jgi:hypothetical protein
VGRLAVDGVEHTSQDGAQHVGQDGHDDCGEQQPDDDGVPLPAPECVAGGPGMDAHGVDQLFGVERRRLGVEEGVAGAQVKDDERKLQGEEQMVGDLRGD